MKQEYVEQFYIEAASKCKYGEAWEFEKHYADVILTNIMRVIAAQALSGESALDVFSNLSRIYEGIELRPKPEFEKVSGDIYDF